MTGRRSKSGAIRTYEVSVDGFRAGLYCGRTPAAARYQAYLAFTEGWETSFRGFLARSSIRRVENPPGVGERIVVCGKSATRVLPVGQYVGFVRDGSNVVLCAHPAEVASAP